MEERGITISKLIENLKDTDKKIILIGSGVGADAAARVMERAQRILGEENFAIIDVSSFSTKEILEHAKTLPNGRGVVIIEDFEERITRETRENIVLKLTAVKHEFIDTFVLPEKKEYGISKNKKPISPPNHKGFVKPKFTLRGRHR